MKDMNPDREHRMSEAGRLDNERSGKITRKRLISAAKVVLGLAILFVVLWNVKVRDHLTLPDGVPHAGIHPGMFERFPEGDGEHVRFRKPGNFLFDATLDAQGQMVRAVITTEGAGAGTPHAIPESAFPDIGMRDGLFTVLENMHLSYWALALAVYFFALTLTAFRWGLLLRATDLPQGPGRAFRLTFIGFFFNNVVPGQTGGDLVRAFYISRENPDRKTDSIITVIVDRALGITALAIIGAVIIPTDWELYGKCAPLIYGLIGGVTVLGLIFYSKRVRRKFRLDRLLKKLPFQDALQNLDRSIFLYRYRKGSIVTCFLMSFAVHGIIIASLWILGKGIGIELSILTYMAYVPIIFIISSLPITPGGWGVGEAVFVFFFGLAGVLSAQALALSLLFRVTAALVSLVGGGFLLFERRRGDYR